MSATAVRAPAEFESRLQQYYFERSEESRAVRVGEKEVSEQAAIVARYADLFSHDQLAALRVAEEAAAGDERERLYRLRKTCEGGLISAELAEQEDALENAILGAGVTFKGEELSLRAAQARLAVLDSYADREELGELERAESARLNPDRLALLAAYERLDGEVSGEPDPIARNEEEKAISLTRARAGARRRRRRDDGGVRPAARPLVRAAARAGAGRSSRRTRHVVLPAPSVAVRVDVHEGAVGRGLPGDRAGARLRHDRDPEHPPRPRGPAAEEPARVRDRVRSAGGRAPDHPCAGRARRLPGVPARGRARAPLRGRRPAAAVHVPAHLARPRADGDLLVHLRVDHARAGLARAALRTRRMRRRRRTREATLFLEALLYRRYTAKLRYELGFWASFAEEAGRSPRDYATRLTEATGIRYDPRDYLADMDRRLLLGRLPARVDSLRAAARAPGRARSARTGGAARRPASSSATSSPRARSRRARRSPRGSASRRSTRRRSSRISQRPSACTRGGSARPVARCRRSASAPGRSAAAGARRTTRESLAAMHAAVDAGVTFFDTADVYGDGRSERLVARLLRERDEPLVVATKFGRRAAAAGRRATTRTSNLRGWLERSLENLDVETVDLVQLHCPPWDAYYTPVGVRGVRPARRRRPHARVRRQRREGRGGAEGDRVSGRRDRADHLQHLPPAARRAVLRAGRACATSA